MCENPSNKRFADLLPLILLGLLLFAYTYVLVTYNAPITGGMDQNGYHNSARMLETGGVLYRKPADDLEYIGIMWVVNKYGEFFPKYPPILPVIIALLDILFGVGSGLYVSVLGGIASVGGMYALTRCFAGRWASLAASAILAFSPIVTELGIEKNSHTPGLAFLIWGLTLFFIAVKQRRGGWKMYLPLFFSGFLVACCTGIRYSDFLLFFIPPAYALFLTRGRRRWKLLAGYAAGAAWPFGFLAWFHTYAYGAPWRTGYSLTQETSGFKPEFMLENIQIYLPDFFRIYMGPISVFMLVIWRKHIRRAFVWCAWLLPTFVLYLMYYWAPEEEGSATMRFLTPLAPCVVLLVVLSLRRLSFKMRRLKDLFMISVILLAVLQGIWGWTRITTLCEIKYWVGLNMSVYQEVVRNMVPAGANLISRTDLLENFDYDLKWHLYPSYILNTNEMRNVMYWTNESHASGLQYERAKKLYYHLGSLEGENLHAVIREFLLRKIEKGEDVYFFGKPLEAHIFRKVCYKQFKLERVLTVSGEIEPKQFRTTGKRANRYDERDVMSELLVSELWRIKGVRTSPPDDFEIEAVLEGERNEIMDRLNPYHEKNEQQDIIRLEMLRDELTKVRERNDRVRRENGITSPHDVNALILPRTEKSKKKK